MSFAQILPLCNDHEDEVRRRRRRLGHHGHDGRLPRRQRRRGSRSCSEWRCSSPGTTIPQSWAVSEIVLVFFLAITINSLVSG
jgi:hypothetical protein